MSEDREPGRPADEAQAPREVRGPSSYAVTLAALEAALAEPMPEGGEADVDALLPVRGA